MSRDPESAELTASPIPPVEIKQHQTVILMEKCDAVHFRSSASLVHAFSCLCGSIIQNETTQECIPVGCVPLARYRTGGLCPGVSLTETTLPWTKTPQSCGLWCMLGQRPPPPVNRITDSCKNITLLQPHCGW